MHYSASHGCHLIQSSFLWGWDIVTPVCAAPNSYSEKKGAHMCNHNDSSNISLCSSSGVSSKGRRGHICELATATMGLVATSCQQWWQNQLQRKNGTQTRAREHERGLPSLKSAWHINLVWPWLDLKTGSQQVKPFWDWTRLPMWLWLLLTPEVTRGWLTMVSSHGITTWIQIGNLWWY